MQELDRKVEALLFATKLRLTVDDIAGRCGCLPEEAEQSIRRLTAFHNRGYIRLLREEDVVRFSVDVGKVQADLAEMKRDEPDLQAIVRGLGQSALTVLAVIAVNQPISYPDIHEMIPDGVTRKVIERLIKLGFVEVAGRGSSTGRIVAYRTTALFLKAYDLDSIRSLPTSEDIFAEYGQPDSLPLADISGSGSAAAGEHQPAAVQPATPAEP